ncbi:hypothetical protein [Polymorphobacter sp.]|uniref:hypothetical protein n=1 Tax=Polymorphobacter sp. TaxID=1909290 RepID=UPI003F70DAEE
MAIISAAVESNGWVLQLVVSGGAGGFSDYALDPDAATPAVVVRSAHAGFVQAGGVAVPGSMARAIPATTALRLPVNPASPNTPVIDETDLGGGQRRVRLALANHVYATDTGVTLDVRAGWRSGEGAATGIAVTNGSTLAAPVPIFRWAELQFRVATGSFRLSLIVASHHPNGFQPVAGVKFTATDGVGMKTAWTTALGTETSYGDALRCYHVDIDPATATALTAGLLRCDAEVYPWLGAMRSTDPAGTRSMTDLRIVGRGSGAETPLVVGHDPAGDRYSSQWVYVDAANGTTLASAAMVATSLAGAKAVSPASRPANVTTAMQALYLQNRTLPAANGGSSFSRSCDGARIVLAPGVSVYGTATVTSGQNTGEIPLIIQGDPDDSDPRANCILRSGTSAPTTRASRASWKDLTIEIGQATLQTSAVFGWIDNCTVRGKAGFETSTSSLTNTGHTAGTQAFSVVNSRWWRAGIGMDTSQLRMGLIRNCEFSRLARGFAILTSRFIGLEDDTVSNQSAIGHLPVTSDLGGREDVFFAYNDLRGVRTRAIQLSFPSAALAGTIWPSYRRNVILGNVFEMQAPTGTQPFFAVGEGGVTSAHYNIIENNSFFGERVNAWYNDPGACDSSQNGDLICNRQANNAYDRNATKHDNFLDGACAGNGFGGYRPWLTGGWSAYMGVMHEGNWDGGRAASDIGAFRYWFRGLRSVQTTVATAPGVVDDRSVFGSNNGGGDYRPSAGSPLLGRMAGSNTDRDLNGNVRAVGSPAGAFEAAGMGLGLEPAPGRHGLASTAPGLSTAAGLVPADARHGHLVRSPAVAALTLLAPAEGSHASRTSTTALLLSVGVAPAPAAHLLLTRSPTLEPGGAVLVPGQATHAMGTATALLSLPVAGVGARRLAVGPELRTGFARLG